MPAKRKANAPTERTSIRGYEACFRIWHYAPFRNVQRIDRSTGRRSGAKTPANYVLANPPFNDSDTAVRGSAFLQAGGTLQVMAERHDNFPKDDDVRRHKGETDSNSKRSWR